MKRSQEQLIEYERAVRRQMERDQEDAFNALLEHRYPDVHDAVELMEDKARALAVLEGLEQPDDLISLHASAALVQEAWMRLTRDENERIVFGIALEGVLIRLVEVPYEARGIAGAEALRHASHRLVVSAISNDHEIACMWHNHPGAGISATLPSDVDLRTQELWERGHDIVGGVFSRDGYLRLFTVTRPFQANIVGKGVKQLEMDTYRILESEQKALALPNPQGACAGGGSTNARDGLDANNSDAGSHPYRRRWRPRWRRRQGGNPGRRRKD